MPIVLARIDDRLIHGQVVEGWLRNINANHIIVVSDEVAKDKMQQTLLTIAVPTHVKVSTFSIEEAINKLQEGQFAKDKILLLFSSPQDVLSLLKNGVKLRSVNVGGMHYVEGKKQILRALSVDKNDILVFKEIINMNVEVEGRVLPNDEKTSIAGVIDKEFKNLEKNQ